MAPLASAQMRSRAATSPSLPLPELNVISMLVGAPAAMLQVLNGSQFFVGEDGMRNAQPMRMLLGGFQQVALWPDVAFQGHDDFFANRIDSRIRDLSEALLEIIVEHARFV